MRKLHLLSKNTILQTVDFFYPPFRRFLPLQLFRYAVCGGANMALGMLLYPLLYNFVFKQYAFVETSLLGINLAIKPENAALLCNFLVTLPLGFYLSMYVVFPGSHLRRRIQFIRYFIVAIINLALNYLLMKLFVRVFGWFPTPSYWTTVVIVVAFTYFVQRSFTFSQKKAELTPYEQPIE